MGAMLASQLGSLGGMAALAGGSLGLKNPNDRYVAMLQSRTVEDAMVQRFGLMQEYHAHYLSDARKDFESHATVDGNGKDGLIHISVEDHDANTSSRTGQWICRSVSGPVSASRHYGSFSAQALLSAGT